MDLTPSAFNILLNMTELNQSPLCTSKAQVESANQKTGEPRRRVRPAEPEIYYHDGTISKIITRKDLVELISMNPSKKHLLWALGNQRWRSWKELPSLKYAVMKRISARRPKNIEELTKVHHTLPLDHTEKDRAVVSSSMSTLQKKTSPVQMTQQQIVNSNGYSVPETVFTHFEVDLCDTENSRVFVGLDQSLTNSGLFIATQIVLNVGDIIQIKVRVRGKVFLSIEAPIAWLRRSDTMTSLPEGVAVMWPSLTTQQIKVIMMATKGQEYEFFVA